ncbi:MAG: twin-arginine translocase TatA/TatE family subunit [Crocinitomicaceae bacterium]|jgi:TatA/E family protein of Tat protein translocase|nr:twin-arginine translocase TatA/TatE family subunit [Crocinitomicaceae bacterium]MDG2464658.1 twin-arginine translocase TatA/TatE family subunit [Crocinitomicaceae bacterium]
MVLIFNDIAGTEILLILVFILIFFGSKSIPGIAQSLGRTMRQIKDASQDVQNEIKKSGMDIKKDLNLKGLISETEQTLRRPLDQMSNDINEVVDSTRKPYKPVVPPPQTADDAAKDEPVKVEPIKVEPGKVEKTDIAPKSDTEKA